MAETNLYKLLSGLYTAASNINTKVGNKNDQNGSAFEQLTALSTAVDGKFTPRLANGTSGLVYSANGGDVTIAAGVITLKNGVVDTAELKNGAVTADKLASTVSSQIGHGETAYGKVSGSGEWHSHTNKTTLAGIGDTDVAHWNEAYNKKHEHSNLADLEGITSAKIAAWDAASTANHSHSNKSVLDGINADKVAAWDTAVTSAHFHANKAVLDGITAAKITAWDNGAKISGVTLEKLTTPTAGYAASYQLKVNGSTTNIPTIDIVKDQFIKTAAFGWANDDTSNPSSWSATKTSTAKFPCIKIEVFTNADGVSNNDTVVSTIYVPLADVFQEYVGGANIKVDGNVISLSGTIPDGNIASATSWNTAATRAADWANTSGKVVKTSDNLTTDHIVLGNNNDKTVKKSDYTVVSASANFGANTLATAPAITGYIAAQGFQKSASMGSYVTAAANLEAETIVMGAGGKAVASGKKIVSTSGDIAATSGAAMIPTAGAVSSYVANKTTGMVTGTGLTADKLVAGNNGGAVKITSIATGDVVTAAANLTSGKLVVAAGDNKAIAGTSYGVNTASGSVGAANQISTDDALTGYFASKNADFVSAPNNLTKDQIVLGNNNDKTVKQSGLTVGTTSGSIGTANTASATIPRSDAVSSYVANKTANMVTATATLPAANLIVGNGSKGVASSSIVAANVVTATNALADNDIVLGAGANKTIKKSGYSITSGAADITNGATAKVPTASAVKSYVDAQDTADKNYLLNGDAANDDGVTEWGSTTTTAGTGSLAELNARVNALLESI